MATNLSEGIDSVGTTVCRFYLLFPTVVNN